MALRLRPSSSAAGPARLVLALAFLTVAHALLLPAVPPPPRARAPEMAAPAAPSKILDFVRSTAETTFSLHDAAAAGDANAVDLMLLAGLDASSPNAKSSTPLHLAAANGAADVVELLLGHGAAASAPNDDGNTPLHAALLRGHDDAARLLLARGAATDATSNSGLRPLAIAARRGNTAMVDALVEAGAAFDEAAADAAFWAAVALVEATPDDEALTAEAPRLLHRVFDADFALLQRRERVTTNVTCMQPALEGGVEGLKAGIGYIFDDDDHANLPLKEGRRCTDGQCCDACSRVLFPAMALPTEYDLERFPELEKFNFNDCTKMDTATTLNFVRLVERIRRSIAHEYGLPLSTILPLQAYSRKYVAGTSQKGGGGGEGDHVILHTDEATHATYHYSSVLYFSTQGEDFEGGTFLWNDPVEGWQPFDEDGAPEGFVSEKEEAPELLIPDMPFLEPNAKPFAYCEAVAPGGPAEAAGMRVGDRLLAFGSVQQGDTSNADALAAVASEAAESWAAGEPVDIAVKRDDGSATMLTLLAVEGKLGCAIVAEPESDADGGGAAAAAGAAMEAGKNVGRKLTPLHPTKGAAVIFSSGWENMHQVDKLTSGTRFAVPCFFTTEPVPEMSIDALGGIPATDDDIADDLQNLLVGASPLENPMQSAGRVKALMIKWHMLMTPPPAC